MDTSTDNEGEALTRILNALADLRVALAALTVALDKRAPS